ncbi:hypothetical protein NH287_03725 [Microbacterium sp. CnD16-F]|uniref:hypothetical protein n=1 Tax=Microbacterium TaxID=33882 RepID=UPI002097D9ED|nr:hypothetical protein [Microbacterium sp. CnD16-F]MCO7202619.1 hypothetical protein [Microbacterium sp. CnD16-F]
MSAAGFGHLNQRDESVADPVAPFDPLRLCVFATIAVIAAVTGPLAVAFFAGVAIAGYMRARRAGLLRSRCKLGDTRLVLAYLCVLEVLALAAIPLWVMLWMRLLG